MPKPFFVYKQPWVKDTGRNSSESTFSYNKDKKRVTFKPNKHGPKKDGKDWNTACREYLLDEDVDMGITAGSSRAFPKRFNKGNKKPKGGVNVVSGRRPLLEGPNSWYKVQVSKSLKYDSAIAQYIANNPLHSLPL